MKRTFWSFTSNTFLNSTKKSFRKALKLSGAHDKALYQKTIDFPMEPKWGIVYTRYHAEHLAFKAAYSIWKASGGSLSGNTQTVNELLKSIPHMLDRWLAAIIPVYDKASAKFKALFPNGRAPFEVGKIDERITAVNTLHTAIVPDVALANAKILIEADYTILDGARSKQEGGKSTIKSQSELLESCRVSAMTMQYRDVGYLIDNFYDQPKTIESVFDLQTLRESIQSFFTRTMKITEVSEITKNTFTATDEIRIKVSNIDNITDKITLYLDKTKGGTSTTGLDFFSNSDQTITAAQFLVDLTTHTYLTAVTSNNLSPFKLSIELY